MVRIFERERLWERGQGQRAEFRLRTESRPMKNPRLDYNGKLLVANENHYLLDDSYSAKDPRHIVLHAHCFRTIDGEIGASGKIDPKEIFIEGTEYRQLEFRNPRCELCEEGDMIPQNERFMSSTYRP
jgi:hypothetical protein